MATALHHRKTYDPGQPGEVSALGKGCFLVESWRGEGAYFVDLCDEINTCDCPLHQNKIKPARERGEDVSDCKHVTQAWEKQRVLRGYQPEPTPPAPAAPAVPMPSSLDLETYGREVCAFFDAALAAA